MKAEAMKHNADSLSRPDLSNHRLRIMLLALVAAIVAYLLIKPGLGPDWQRPGTAIMQSLAIAHVTQRIVWDNDAATRTDLYISNQIGQDWRFLAGTQWEPNTEQRVNQVVGIEYESCCWRAAVVHAYERDQVTSTNGGHSVKLQVELKGLGVLGRGASSIMERLLEDYEPSEARY